MELVLNLVWMMLTALMLWLWLGHAARDGASRGTQFVALAITILILLPTISLTDDLMWAQNPAETDCFQRKSQLCATAHSTQSLAADLPPLFSAEPYPDSFHSAVLGNVRTPSLRVPATDSIQNRPPPAGEPIDRFC